MDHLQLNHRSFQIPGQLPTGFGAVTFNRLLQFGLLESGAGRHGITGYRLTEDGWRCMYGKTLAEMSGTGPYHPLRVWSWPPSNR